MNKPAGMAGRFSARRAPVPEPVPEEETSSTLEGISWTVFPEEQAREGVVHGPDHDAMTRVVALELVAVDEAHIRRHVFEQFR